MGQLTVYGSGEGDRVQMRDGQATGTIRRIDGGGRAEVVWDTKAVCLVPLTWVNGEAEERGRQREGSG